MTEPRYVVTYQILTTEIIGLAETLRRELRASGFGGTLFSGGRIPSDTLAAPGRHQEALI
ncbi:MAG: hypothetical protein OK457_05710 [Thaumarchaeota archaeon]|nr:hypothetical protein [Nitrososphaerota archaeon]